MSLPDHSKAHHSPVDHVLIGHHVHKPTSSQHLHTLSSEQRRSLVAEKGLGRGSELEEHGQQTRTYKRSMNQIHPSDERDYIPIADHALIGNLRTAALVSLDGSIESYCVPNFDSPSVFARILDKDKGGHFSITPLQPFTTKQNYLPSSNVLQTKFMNDAGVVSVTDFLPRPPLGVVPPDSAGHTSAKINTSGGKKSPKPLLQWVVRRIECVRGTLPLRMQCAPAFNYARDEHTTTLIEDESRPSSEKDSCEDSVTSSEEQSPPEGERHLKALFESPDLVMDLRYVAHNSAAHEFAASTLSKKAPSSDDESDGSLTDDEASASGLGGHPHRHGDHITPLSVDDIEGDDFSPPKINLELLDLSHKGHKGLAVQSDFVLKEGEGVTFVFRIVPGGEKGYGNRTEKSSKSEAKGSGVEGVTQEVREEGRDKTPTTSSIFVGGTEKAIAKSSKVGRGDKKRGRSLYDRRPGDDPWLTEELVSSLLQTTHKYWATWVRQSSYEGSWKESVLRSALALKLLIFEPTGAVVASPTFSLPEYIGGVRNWDYRYSWIRDSSFTLYALIRLGYTEEANAYLDFIFDRIRDKNPDGSIQIMYTIHGDKDMSEIELDHLDGHKGSKPVRIGNGAADHIQLDIYGELMDCIYLGQKFGKPLSYDDWVLVREIVDYVVEHCNDSDLSIWEVRDMKRNFTYSKVMLWVAIDRGLRLAEKRSLPCPNRFKWLKARDELYEDIMHKAWNKEERFFGQSYEETDIVDAAVLIMPLVFFMQASDPRFVSTLKRIMKTPEKGGLTANNLVYRYDVRKSGDGVGGEEGTFCLCTLWCVEALTRAGKTDKALLTKAISMFEDFLLYLNHVGLCTEEISDAGEALGNAVQGFTHVTLISAAYNLSRTMHTLHQPAV
ncbi:Six-hairpin glycosidase [Coprinopsis marcescibilis]|uniref:Six-hairpin glycosidase n=1 Tax=Coprinopsis marcescibilis TaxID=230819 RepID=A0A5C3KCY9_COPMA|nr:Six-hairpin glycosidase [Coprinopsis marcescibilis]